MRLVRSWTMVSLARFRHLAVALDPAARRIRSEITRLARELEPADRVLDLGSGEAPYARLFQHRRYVTADLFAAADVRCDATILPFPSQAFDLVLCTEVLEHVPDPDATLREIRRVLVDRGALILTTPLTWGVHAVHDYHRWTESGLVRLLARHGFHVDRVRTRGGIFLALGALLLMIPWQVFGEARERRWWQTVLYGAGYTLLVVPALALAALDPLDRRKHFTQGYVSLARSAATPAVAAEGPASGGWPSRPSPGGAPGPRPGAPP
jgi:SAM-dependent methyltransferase